MVCVCVCALSRVDKLARELGWMIRVDPTDRVEVKRDYCTHYHLPLGHSPTVVCGEGSVVVDVIVSVLLVSKIEREWYTRTNTIHMYSVCTDTFIITQHTYIAIWELCVMLW